MTLTSTTTRNEYIGTGITGPYAYGFRIFAATDLLVTTRDADTDTETTLSYPSGYTVSGVGNRSGGSITLATALATGDTLVIRRVLALTQTTSIRNQGPFHANTHEDVFDRLVMIDQQQQDEIERSVRLPETVDPDDVSVELPVPSAGKALVWNDDADALDNRTLDNTTIALPGEGRTVGSLTNYLGNNAVYNVKDYGATGDGVTDDTDAILAALAAAALVCGTVIAPPGHYRYSATITIPKGVQLIGAGLGISAAIPGTRFTALASFPVSTVHFQLGDPASLSFGSRIQDCRIFCSRIAGSIAINCPTIQENSGLLRVLVQDYMSVGIQCIEPVAGGSLFADNCLIEDCQAWCSASATGSIGLDINTSHRNFVVRKFSAVPSASPPDQLAAVRITGAIAGGGSPRLYGIHGERHTDVIYVGTNGGVRADNVSIAVSGTNVVNITSAQECVLTDISRTTLVGTNTVANSVLGENITTQRVAYYFAADTAEGYQVFTSAGTNSTHGNVMSSSGAKYTIKSTPTSGGSSRCLYRLRDGNNDGWDIQFSADGADDPLQIIPVTAGTQGTSVINLTDRGALQGFRTTNGPVGSFTLGAAATTAVGNALITASSKIYLVPTNAAAATLMGGSKSLYISAKTASTSFTVATADGTSAVGTETFDYIILN